MKRIGLIVLVVVALLVFDVRSGSHHAAQPGAQKPEFVADELIVKFREGVDEFTKDMARFRVSGTRKKVFKYVPGLEVVKLRRGVSLEEAIKAYEQDPNVSYAEPNYILKTQLTPNDPRFASGEMWGLHNTGQAGGSADADIDAVEAWNQTTGSSSLIVAIIDSGVDYNHPDLAANMFRNEADCNSNGIDDDGNGYIDDCYGIDTHNDDSNPMDDNNHGTHVAGTIGARGNNGAGVTGINWNIKLMACKFVNASGSGTTESAIDCLEYVKTMRDRGFNIFATSNSWGGGPYSQALYDAIDIQRQRGILFITAAGNGNIFGTGVNNDSVPFYPCTYFLPNIICTASTTRTDARSGFSNYGRRTVHIGAPGSDILSTTRNEGYGFSSGTSMATPHVSGVAALLKAQDPTRDWRAIKNLILAGGDNKSSMSNTVTGKRLNASGSMNCSNAMVQSRLKPIVTTISASPGVPVDLASLHIRCAVPNGNVAVSVTPGNTVITLLDDGAGSDQTAGDGIYSGQWTPSTPGTYTLTFPGNDQITVNVANPTIDVTPSSIDFGSVGVSSSIDKSFTVKNIGAGILAGVASTSAPYSIVAGGNYSLSGGQSQTVTVRFTPTSLGTFSGNVIFTGGAGASSTVIGSSAQAYSMTPSTIDLVSPPSSFIVQGSGFKNLGYGLPVVNWQRDGVNIAQARATAMTDTTLTVPYPTDTTSIGGPRPGLSVGSATVVVYHQTGTNSFNVIGTLPFTIADSNPASATSITPNSIDLASPPSSFTVQGSGFKNLGYGLPVVNWQRDGVNIAQARATAMTSTTLTVPYPTNATSIGGPRPGLSVGSATVVVYHQTGSNTFTPIGTLPFTITSTASIASITPSSVDLASPPLSFTVQGSGFKNFGYGLPVVNWQRDGVNIAQARATAMTSTTLTVPYPTNATSIGGPRPGLSVGSATVVVYHQTGANSFSVIGTLPFTITSAASVASITPSSVDLASPPITFTVQGSGFKNLGFGLPVVNWQRNGVNIAQARATAMTSTSLTVPYPTNATSIGGPRPGLSVGSATVVVYHQIGTNSFSVIGTLPFTITDSQITNLMLTRGLQTSE